MASARQQVLANFELQRDIFLKFLYNIQNVWVTNFRLQVDNF